MGVYIPNMELPPCCGKCILQDGEMCFAIDDGGDGLSLFSLEDLRDFCIKRRDDCPLIEVSDEIWEALKPKVETMSLAERGWITDDSNT